MSCSSSVNFRSCLADFVKLSSFRPESSGQDVTIDSVITISPTIAIKLSSLDKFTLIKLCLFCILCVVDSCFLGACLGVAGAFFGSSFLGFAASGFASGSETAACTGSLFVACVLSLAGFLIVS